MGSRNPFIRQWLILTPCIFGWLFFFFAFLLPEENRADGGMFISAVLHHDYFYAARIFHFYDIKMTKGQGMMAYYKLWWSLTIIGPDNGLSSIQCQAIICTKAGFLSIGPWGINSSKILIKIKTFLFKKILLKMLFKMATILYQPRINVWVISNKINVNFMTAWSKFWINIKMVIQNLLLAFRKWYGCL